MFLLRCKLFNLPIHQRSYKVYYKCADKAKEEMIKAVEELWGKPYDKVPRTNRINYEDRCWLPPWEFNDIIGYVDVGMDATDRLVGNMYLMRKYFPKESWEMRYRRSDKPARKQQILHSRELGPIVIEWNNNSSYINGINEILGEAENTIKKLSKTRKYKWVLQQLPFPLECIDFVRLASAVHPKFPK